MSEFAVLAVLLAGSMVLNTWLTAYVVRFQRKEIGKLQAASLVTGAGPLQSAVYQGYQPEDERSPEMQLEDTPQVQNRDTKPMGL